MQEDLFEEIMKQEVHYLGGNVGDMVKHYFHNYPHYDANLRGIVIVNVLSSLLKQVLSQTDAPKDILGNFLLKPYQELLAELEKKKH